MSIATITSKGQITIPAEVRKDLAVGTGDRLEFILVEPGKYMVIAKIKDVRELKGVRICTVGPST